MKKIFYALSILFITSQAFGQSTTTWLEVNNRITTPLNYEICPAKQGFNASLCKHGTIPSGMAQEISVPVGSVAVKIDNNIMQYNVKGPSSLTCASNCTFKEEF